MGGSESFFESSTEGEGSACSPKVSWHVGGLQERGFELWQILDREMSSANMQLQALARHLQAIVAKPFYRSGKVTFENHFMVATQGL